MTRARDLSRLANDNALTADSLGNVGVGSTQPTAKLNVVGVVSATSFYGDGTNLSNTGSTLSAASGTERVVLTNLTSGTMTASSTDAALTWNSTTGTLSATNVSVAGTLTYEDVTNVDSVGLITARNGAIINAGTATTALIVEGDARVTGILTIGTSSVTLDGTNNQVNVGTGVTIHHTNGVQVGNNTLHSTGLTINNANVTGILTAASFSGDGSGLTGVGGGTSISQGNTSVEAIDTGSDGNVRINIEGTEALRVNDRKQVLLGATGFAAATSPTASYTQYTPLHLIGGTGTNNGSSIFIARNQAASASSNQDLGAVIWGTNDGAPFSRIASFVDGNSSGSSYPGYLTFQTTASGATTPTERMRVDSAGRILGNNTSIFATGRLFTPSFSSGTVNLYLFTGSQPSGTGTYNYYQQLPAGTQGGIYEVAAFGGPEYSGVGPGSALIYALFSVNYNGVFSTITSNVRINPDPGNPAFMNASWNTSTNFVHASWGNQGYQNYPMLYFRRLGAYL